MAIGQTVRATQRSTRQSPYKMRLVIDEIRGKSVNDALAYLQFSKKHAAKQIEKTLRSAVANANESDAPPRQTLFVAKAWVDPGPVIKRFQPKDRGKAYSIKKRTSHLVVTVDERA